VNKYKHTRAVGLDATNFPQVDSEPEDDAAQQSLCDDVLDEDETVWDSASAAGTHSPNSQSVRGSSAKHTTSPPPVESPGENIVCHLEELQGIAELGELESQEFIDPNKHAHRRPPTLREEPPSPFPKRLCAQPYDHA
jgi:hypothetical protein